MNSEINYALLYPLNWRKFRVEIIISVWQRPTSPGSTKCPKQDGPKRPIPRYTIIKMAKLKDKERILKTIRERQLVKGACHLISQQKHFRPDGIGMKYSK